MTREEFNEENAKFIYYNYNKLSTLIRRVIDLSEIDCEGDIRISNESFFSTDYRDLVVDFHIVIRVNQEYHYSPADSFSEIWLKTPFLRDLFKMNLYGRYSCTFLFDGEELKKALQLSEMTDKELLLYLKLN